MGLKHLMVLLKVPPPRMLGYPVHIQPRCWKWFTKFSIPRPQTERGLLTKPKPMTTELLIQISPEGKLELPPEVQTRLKSGDKYLISMTEDSITLKKVHEDKINLEQFFKRLETMEPDPHQLTLAEISQMVKEARLSRRTNP